MYNVLDVKGVRAAEEKIINGGDGGMLLRLNAALAVADKILPRANGEWAKTAVFCGAGGNGYDGILIAVRLKRLGCDVRLYIVGDRSTFSHDALVYAQNSGLVAADAKDYDGDATVIVDAIYGIGLNRNIVGETAELIEKLNGENAFKVAVDIPSGLNADSGNIMGVAFRADLTITFSCYKPGMLFNVGRDYCGTVTVEQIGVDCESIVKVYGNGDFKPLRRNRSTHKGKAGRIFVIGGCGEMIGAPILAGAAAHAAYLNGAGTATLCLPQIHRAAAASRAVMSMMKFLPDTKDGFVKFDKAVLDEIISKAAAIDIGVGMGATPDLKRILEYICANFGGTLIIDADALNAIKLDYKFLKDSKAKIILTPHVGEFKRLTGNDADIENAVALAKDTGAVVVLKSSTTIITDGNEVRLNVAGTPAMAKGGMGDVLGGCIAALACSFDTFDAACIACYRNGMGAEQAVSSFSELMLTARDVLKYADYGEV